MSEGNTISQFNFISNLWMEERISHRPKDSVISLDLSKYELEKGGKGFWVLYKEMVIFRRLEDMDVIHSKFIYLDGTLDGCFKIDNAVGYNGVNVLTDIKYPSWSRFG